MLLLIAFYCDIVGIPVHWICNDLMESLLYIAQRLTNNNIRLCTGLLRKSRSVCFAGCKAKQFVGNQVILSCLFRIRECVRGTCPRYSALLLTLHVKLSRLDQRCLWKRKPWMPIQEDRTLGIYRWHSQRDAGKEKELAMITSHLQDINQTRRTNRQAPATVCGDQS